jgi:hypothetical protein
MPTKISPRALSVYYRRLALKRWRLATPEQRSQAARHASLIRWQKFRAWKESHAEEAAAASAIARAARALRPKREPSDDELVERLVRQLARAQAASSANLP